MTKSKPSGARLNARLDADLNEKLEYLKRRTKLGVTDVVKRSIECYYEEVRRGASDAREILEQSGFVGCAEGDPNLSSDYKQALIESLGRKA
jgi:hypothetical protein